MLASNEDLKKSMPFLMPGLKLVLKTLLSESFSRIEQLKSLAKSGSVQVDIMDYNVGMGFLGDK